MARPLVLIFHRPAANDDPTLVRLLAEARGELAERQARLFRLSGAGEVRLETEWHAGLSFGEVLAQIAPARGGLVVLGSGAIVRMNATDSRRLVATAASGERRAVTNNRYSSDICAIGRAIDLRALPALPSDNALPRWLQEHAHYSVEDLPGRDRLALDLDTPLDLALGAMAPGVGAWLKTLVDRSALTIPRLTQIRVVAADAHAELLIFGRSGSATLRWLERNVRCRVRFLAEERGLRASTSLAIGGPPGRTRRAPAATLGLLLDHGGPKALTNVVAALADGVILDSRVLMAHHFGPSELDWPSDNDRFASDLHQPAEVTDTWLRALTQSAADAQIPILFGGHSLLGPGIPLLLGQGR